MSAIFITPPSNNYIYIYIYVCVCVCVLLFFILCDFVYSMKNKIIKYIIYCTLYLSYVLIKKLNYIESNILNTS